MGWTGVQYSLLRAGIALAVAQVCLARIDGVDPAVRTLLLLGLPGALALSVGWRDRAVTLNLLLLIGGLAAFVDGAPLVMPRMDIVLTSGLLILHACVPVTPFGSWDARARVDPRGEWIRPSWIGHLAWAGLGLVQLYASYARWGTPTSPGFEPGLHGASLLALPLVAFFVLALVRVAFRPSAWIALTLWQIGWTAASGPTPDSLALLLLHAFAADPGWWPGRRLSPLAGPTASPARLFYDGDCGFCHRSVRFILSEDVDTPPELGLRFAPLGSETFQRTLAAHPDLDPEALPDSILLATEDGRILTRSAAVLEIASRLGGLWRLVALIGNALPSRPLDLAYETLASVRKRLFAQPEGACPILSPELRARFDV